MPTHSAIMSDNIVWMLTSLLLLAADLLSLTTAQENSYTLGRTVPSNDTALEVNAGGRETFICQFIRNSENIDTTLKIRWFFNGIEIIFNESLPGIVFSVTNNDERIAESNLTLDIDDPAILHDGVITCYPPGNETTGDVFAVFRTFLAPRTVTIRWNNPLVFVNESEGNVMLCATAHGWTTAESNLTVLLSYSGTARVNEDYMAGPGTLAFTQSTACIGIEIVDDSTYEPEEHILLDMAPAQDLTHMTGEVNTVTSTAAKVVITDEDEGTRVGIDVPDKVLPEAIGQTEVCIRVLSDEECPITFAFNISLRVIIDNTTSATGDDGDETIPLKFQRCTKEQCVQILIADDDRAENEERIVFRLEIPGSPGNGIIPRERERVITIIDDDVFPEHSTYTVPENGRSVEVCFVGRGAPLPQPVALTLSTHNNGSATAGEDYMALHSAPLILASESGRGCVEVPIIPDDLLEDTENFSISLDSSTTISAPTVTISIIDTTVCTTGELRLVDGATNNTGRLEVCYNGEWGTVCDDLFNDLAASVACRQLGLEGRSYSGFPNGNLPTLMDDVRCTGNESRLLDCGHKTREGSNCDNTENVGLICGDLCVDGGVKLTSLDVNGDFYVEICHDGKYLQVCGDDWDTFDATVACRLAGFGKYSIAVPDTGFKTYTSRTITNTTCAGTERDFSSCHFNTSDNECLFAAVRCNSTSPCPRGSFWCPESSSSHPVCIPRDGVCNGSTECPDTQADERVCMVVNFTQESYTVGEANETLSVCVRVSFPELPLFTADPAFTLVLHTLQDSNENQDQVTVPLSFDSVNLTQCADIRIVDDNVVAPAKLGFTLSLDSEEDMGLYVNRQRSHLAAFVEIIDDEACNGSSQFLCKSRLECLPLSAICDGVLDCNGTHTDESNCTGFCSEETVYGTSWPWTPSGEAVEMRCPGEHNNRTAARECRDGKWVDTGTCFTFGETLALTERNIVEVLRQLRLVVAGASEEEETYDNAVVIARALASAAALLRKSKLSQGVTEEVLSDIIEILDRLLRWDSEIVGAQGPQNVENFEAVLVSLITSENFKQTLSITREDIALLARPVMAEIHVDSPLVFNISSVDGISRTVGSRKKSNQIAAITFPPSIFNSKQVMETLTEPLAVAVVLYEIPAFFPAPENKKRGPETSVGTPVVSMIVARDGQQLEFDGLEPPVEVTLEVTQAPIENVTNPRCVFWDFTHNEWSTEGCKTRFNASRGQITCTCTHLTNFAALVDVCRRTEGCETSDEAEYALSILSIVGVSLSLMGLTVTIFSMLFFRTLRKRDASKFHAQLCIAMFLMLLVFVAGVRQTEEKAGCVTVSVLIHYFTLATVMWMGAEAVLMFQKLVIVFGKVTTRHIVIISLICWLAPILPVIIPVAINPDYVIFPSEDSSAGFCFISNTAAFFAAFLAPIMVVILFNCTVFIIIITVLVRHKQRNKITGLKTSKTKERQSTIRLMISIAGIMLLYGLTWIFGALTIDKASLSFQVLFVVFNSLQGFFIFLFFCVLGRDGRELWLEFLSCGHYKSSHLHPLSIVTSSAEKRPNHFMLVSDNTSATPAPVLEKIVTSEAGGGTYMVNYVEFSNKSIDNELTVTTDVDDDRLTPEPTTMTFKTDEVDNTENRANGTSHHHPTENGRGPLQQNGGLHATNRETVAESKDSQARDNKDPGTSETPGDQNHQNVDVTSDDDLSIAHV